MTQLNIILSWYKPGVANQPETKSNISLLSYRKEPHHTHGHKWTSHHPFLVHLCSARFIVNIAHEHDNDRTLQTIYCYACYLVGLLVITWEPYETGRRAACG